MEQQDSGNTGSNDKNKNKDDLEKWMMEYLEYSKGISRHWPGLIPAPFRGDGATSQRDKSPPLGISTDRRYLTAAVSFRKLRESLSSREKRCESPPLGITTGVSECITCKRQFLRQEFCACHRKLTPIIDEIQLKSSPAKARPGSSSLLPDPTRSNLSGGGTSTMHDHGSGGQVVGFAHEHGNIEMGGMHSSDDVQGGPTLELRGDSSSRGFADEDSDIEWGRTHSSDGVPSEPRLVDPSSNHRAHEDTRQRLATMVDPLLSVTVQGAFSLVAYKSSDGSSPAKDVLLYLLVFVYVLGFLSALGGKFYPHSKMGVIGLGAAALGFLMTMALVVVHKI